LVVWRLKLDRKRSIWFRVSGVRAEVVGYRDQCIGFRVQVKGLAFRV
jgi:hypothetical protein